MNNVRKFLSFNLSEENLPEVEDKMIEAVPPAYADAVRGFKKKRKELDDHFSEQQKLIDEVVKENDREAHSKFKGTPAMKKMHLSESLFEAVGDEDEFFKKTNESLKKTSLEEKLNKHDIDIFKAKIDNCETEEDLEDTVYEMINYDKKLFRNLMRNLPKAKDFTDKKTIAKDMLDYTDVDMQVDMNEAIEVNVDDEDIKVDSEVITDTPPVPEPGEDMSLAAIINKLIKDEWDAIDGYNTAANTAKEVGNADIAAILTSIGDEEHIHVGELQKALELVAPQANSIEDGYSEASEVID